jgi:microcystin degradation protein MlrC
MAWRILLGEMKQETATFNPCATSIDDFRINKGPAVLSAYRETKTEVAGVVTTLEEDGRFEIVPTMAAAAVSGGPITTNDLNQLIAEFVEQVKLAGACDAICLCLHGAMAGESDGDPEGRLLSEVRAIVGDVPLVISIDLHAVISDRLVELADIIVPYHTYPHTDHFSTGQRAARNLIRLLDGTAKPTVARVKLPMLVRGDELLTATGLFGQAIRMCQDAEQSDNGLAAGVVIGNAFTDVPALQSNVLITTNNDRQSAQRVANEIGQFMWDHRVEFQAELTTLSDAIKQANQSGGLVVFSDAADATASGAAGDSNAILQGLLESSFSKRTLIPIVDQPAVEIAFDRGVDSKIKITLGGTRDHTRFQPLPVTARVKSLHTEPFQYEDGTTAHSGRAAVIVIDSITVLITERPVYVVGRKVFEAHGLDPRDFELVVVKSPNGFRTWYESIASLIVAVDVPGSTSANLKSLPFEHCVRPIFPLDEDAIWSPEL